MTPRDTFETARLTLRPIGTRDLALYCALYCDAETMQHIGVPLSQADAAANLALILEPGRDSRTGWRIWVVEDRQAHIGAGIVGLHVERHVGEIGVVLRTPWRGRGVAADAIEAICRRAFAEGWIDTAFTRHPTAHDDAERLMRKLAFTRSEAPGIVRWELRKSASDNDVAVGVRMLQPGHQASGTAA